MDYWHAPDVYPIIDQYRKYHPTLVGAKFGCIFREKAQKSDGEPIVGKVTKLSDKYKPLLEEDYDYIMELGADAWAELSKSEREAWIDHLLKHCYGEEDESTGEMTWKTRRPEIVAFSDVLDRHGVDWNENLKSLETIDLGDNHDPASSVKKRSTNEDGEEEEEDIGHQADGGDEFEDMIDSL